MYGESCAKDLQSVRRLLVINVMIIWKTVEMYMSSLLSVFCRDIFDSFDTSSLVRVSQNFLSFFCSCFNRPQGVLFVWRRVHLDVYCFYLNYTCLDKCN